MSMVFYIMFCGQQTNVNNRKIILMIVNQEKVVREILTNNVIL